MEILRGQWTFSNLKIKNILDLVCSQNFDASPAHPINRKSYEEEYTNSFVDIKISSMLSSLIHSHHKCSNCFCSKRTAIFKPILTNSPRMEISSPLQIEAGRTNPLRPRRSSIHPSTPCTIFSTYLSDNLKPWWLGPRVWLLKRFGKKIWAGSMMRSKS